MKLIGLLSFFSSQDSSKEIRIKLDEESFAALVRGGELLIQTPGQPDVRMILADIGFNIMQEKLDMSINKIDHYKSHTLVNS